MKYSKENWGMRWQEQLNVNRRKWKAKSPTAHHILKYNNNNLCRYLCSRTNTCFMYIVDKQSNICSSSTVMYTTTICIYCLYWLYLRQITISNNINGIHLSQRKVLLGCWLGSAIWNWNEAQCIYNHLSWFYLQLSGELSVYR